MKQRSLIRNRKKLYLDLQDGLWSCIYKFPFPIKQIRLQRFLCWIDSFQFSSYLINKRNKIQTLWTNPWGRSSRDIHCNNLGLYLGICFSKCSKLFYISFPFFLFSGYRKARKLRGKIISSTLIMKCPGMKSKANMWRIWKPIELLSTENSSKNLKKLRYLINSFLIFRSGLCTAIKRCNGFE